MVEQGEINLVESPLQCSWSFWYDRQKAHSADAQSYRNALVKFASVSTVQGFWRVYSHLKRPSALEQSMTLFMFRSVPDSPPSWEVYPDGGHWLLRIRRSVEGAAAVLAKCWHLLLFAGIGEQFDDLNIIGVTLAIRAKEDIVALWCSSARSSEYRNRVGTRICQILDLDPSLQIEFKTSRECISDGSSHYHAHTIKRLDLPQAPSVDRRRRPNNRSDGDGDNHADNINTSTTSDSSKRSSEVKSNHHKEVSKDGSGSGRKSNHRGGRRNNYRNSNSSNTNTTSSSK